MPSLRSPVFTPCLPLQCSWVPEAKPCPCLEETEAVPSLGAANGMFQRESAQLLPGSWLGQGFGGRRALPQGGLGIPILHPGKASSNGQAWEQPGAILCKGVQSRRPGSREVALLSHRLSVRLWENLSLFFISVSLSTCLSQLGQELRSVTFLP